MDIVLGLLKHLQCESLNQGVSLSDISRKIGSGAQIGFVRPPSPSESTPLIIVVSPAALTAGRTPEASKSLHSGGVIS